MTSGASVFVSLKAMPTMLKLPITIKDKNNGYTQYDKSEKLGQLNPGEML